MPVILMVAGFLRGPFRSFLAGVPAWVWVAIAALGIVWFAHHAGYQSGRVDESNAWQAKAREAAVQAARRAMAQQEGVHRAETADTARTASTAAVIDPLKQEAATHAQTAPARAPCLTGDGLRIDNRAIAAANAAIAASARGRSVSRPAVADPARQ